MGLDMMVAGQSAVFVVDDDPSVRAALESLLRSVGHTVRSFEATQAFLEAERPGVAACLVLDVRLPGPSGLEFLREIAGTPASLPVIFITGHGDIQMSVTAMKWGAIEFLTKPFRDQDLLDAVQRGIELDRGRRSEAAVLAGLMELFGALTPREREVMSLVTAGRTNKEIANALDLREVTVKVHRGNVMRKMRATSLPELVRIADRLEAVTVKA